jgi:uncharacterized membrane protein YkoI
MKNRIGILFAVGLFLLGLSTQAAAQTAEATVKSNIPAALKAQSKISLEDARATALKKVPGVIKEEELEKEKGKLVYSFDIQATGQKDITEVQVSAISGAVVSVEKESAADEAKEKKQATGKPKP